MDFIKQILATVLGSGAVLLLLGKYIDGKREKSRQEHEQQMRELDAAQESRDRVGSTDLEALDAAWQAVADCIAHLSGARWSGYPRLEEKMYAADARLRQRLGSDHELPLAYAKVMAETHDLASKVSELERRLKKEEKSSATDEVKWFTTAFRRFAYLLELRGPIDGARDALEAFEDTMRPYARGEKTP